MYIPCSRMATVILKCERFDPIPIWCFEIPPISSRDYHTSSMCRCWARQDLTDLPSDHVGIMSLNYDRNDLYLKIMFVPSHKLCIRRYISRETNIGGGGLVIARISLWNSLTRCRSLLTRGTHISLAKLGYPYDALHFQHVGITDSHHR